MNVPSSRWDRACIWIMTCSLLLFLFTYQYALGR